MARRENRTSAKEIEIHYLGEMSRNLSQGLEQGTDLTRHGRDVVALPVLAKGPAMVHAFEAALTHGTHREGRGAVLKWEWLLWGLGHVWCVLGEGG